MRAVVGEPLSESDLSVGAYDRIRMGGPGVPL